MAANTRLSLSVLLLLVLASASWPGAQASCYYPSGRIAPNDIPCRDDTPHATCCGQGYACLSNGICQATGKELEKPGASEFVRGACTDKSWRSSSCPLFCIEEGADFLDGGNGIAKCRDTSDDLYFCINGRSAQEASCEEKRKLLYFVGTPLAITTIGFAAKPTSTSSSSSSSTSSTSTTTKSDSESPSSSTNTGATSPTAPLPGQSEGATVSDSQEPLDQTTPSSSSSSPSSSSSSTNIGAIIGGVIGGIAAIALAALGGWLFARRQSAKGNNTNNNNNNDNNNSTTGLELAAPPPFYFTTQQGDRQPEHTEFKYAAHGVYAYPAEVDGGESHPQPQLSPYYELPHNSPNALRDADGETS